METKIFLFRTGTVDTKKNIFLGWLNLHLNKKGLKEAKVISKKLKKENISFAFCSDQIRGKQALIEVLKNHKNTKVIVDHRLRERNYGIFTGHEKELFKNYLPNTYARVHEYYGGEIPNGENLKQVSSRVFSFMNDLIKFIHEQNGDIVICAHTNSMKLIVEYLENLDIKEVSKLKNSPSDLKEYKINVQI